MRTRHEKIKSFNVHESVSVAGCDTEALVAISEQFAELELELIRRSEVTASQIAAERADWAKVGNAIGVVYQSLCDDDTEATMSALSTITYLLSKRGILVPQPVARPKETPPPPPPPPPPPTPAIEETSLFDFAEEVHHAE